jgi:hypothetical protein
LLVFSSTKLEKMAEQVRPGSEVVWEGEGRRQRGEMAQNNVYTCEYMNKKKE